MRLESNIILPVFIGIGYRRAVSQKKTIIIAVSSLLVVVVGYWIFSPSAEGLLGREALTPKQIRTIATRLLLHEDVKIRSQASDKLISAGEAAVPVLKEIGLTHSDADIRLAVCGIIGYTDIDAAIEVAENMYNSSDSNMRALALDAASQLDDPRAVAIMEKAMNDPEAHIRSTAAGKLGAMNSKNAAAKLKESLNDPDPRVRRHAARSLRNLTRTE